MPSRPMWGTPAWGRGWFKRSDEKREKFKPSRIYGTRSTYTKKYDQVESRAPAREGFAGYMRSGLVGSRYGQPTFPPITPASIGAKHSNLSATMFANINRNYRVGLAGMKNYLPRAQFMRIENDVSGNEFTFSQVMVYNKLGENVSKDARVVSRSTSTAAGISPLTSIVSGDTLGTTVWKASGVNADEYVEIDFGQMNDIEFMIFINAPSPNGTKAPFYSTTMYDTTRNITYSDSPFDTTRVQFVPYCFDGTLSRYIVLRPAAGGDGLISLRQIMVFNTSGDNISTGKETYTPVTLEQLYFPFDLSGNNCSTVNTEQYKKEQETLSTYQAKLTEVQEAIQNKQETLNSTVNIIRGYITQLQEAYTTIPGEITPGDIDVAETASLQKHPVYQNMDSWEALGKAIEAFFLAIFDPGRLQREIDAKKREVYDTNLRNIKLYGLVYLNKVIKAKFAEIEQTLQATTSSGLRTTPYAGTETLPAVNTDGSSTDSLRSYIDTVIGKTPFNQDSYQRNLGPMIEVLSPPSGKTFPPDITVHNETFTSIGDLYSKLGSLIQSCFITRAEIRSLSKTNLSVQQQVVQKQQAVVDGYRFKMRSGTFSDYQKGKTLVNGSLADENQWTSAEPNHYWLLDLGKETEVAAVLVYNTVGTPGNRIAGLRVQLYADNGCLRGDATIGSRDVMVPISFMNSIPQRLMNSTPTYFDDFYDEYELQQITDTQETVKEEDYTPPTVGYEMGVFDANVVDIPWDADNKEQSPKSITWGFVSQNASQSLYSKAYMNALNAAGVYDDGNSDQMKPPLYHSAFLKQDYNDATTAGVVQFTDGLIQNGLSEMLEEAMEKGINNWAARAGSKVGQQVAPKAVGATMRSAIWGSRVARGTQKASTKIAGKVAARIAEKAAVATVQRGIMYGTASSMIATGTGLCATGVGCAAGGPMITTGGLIMGIIGGLDLILMVITAVVIQPILDAILEGEGACPPGYKIWSDHVGDTFDFILGMFPIIGTVIDMIKDYYCWRWQHPTGVLKTAVVYPAWMQDRTLSLVYHDWNVAGEYNYDPRGATKGDPGFNLPEKASDIDPNVLKNAYYADFSSVPMMERMCRFYNDKSRNNPFYVEDGRIEYKIITRIKGVMASSEFSCDVRCEMKTVRHDPITGGGYEEEFGCKYSPENDPDFAEETDCFRRFYFTRVGGEKQGEFTVTACTNADYTSPDAMIQSYAQLPVNPADAAPLVQSVPKVFEPQFVRAKKQYNPSTALTGAVNLVGALGAGVGGGKAIKRFGASKTVKNQRAAGNALEGALKASGRRGGLKKTTNDMDSISSPTPDGKTSWLDISSRVGGVVAGAGAAAGLTAATREGTLLGDKIAELSKVDDKTYYRLDPPGTKRTSYTYIVKTPDWAIDMGPVVEQSFGYSPTIQLCDSFITSEGYCADKRIVKQFKEAYEEENPTKHIKEIHVIEPRDRNSDGVGNGCYYKFKQVDYNASTNLESGEPTFAEAVMTNIQVDPNTCLYIPDKIVSKDLYKIRRLEFNPGLIKGVASPTKYYYPTRTLPTDVSGLMGSLLTNPEQYPTRYPKKPFKVPRGIPSSTLGGDTCPTRRCQDKVQVDELVRNFNSLYSDRKIIKVLRGWTPNSTTCEYEVEMLRILPKLDSASGPSGPSGPSGASGASGPSGPSGPSGSVAKNYRAGIPIGTATPDGPTVLARESLAFTVERTPGSSCLFRRVSDTSDTINAAKFVTMKFTKDEYGYDISGGIQTFDERLFALEGEPDQPEYKGETSLLDSAKSFITRIASLVTGANYEQQIEAPLKESNEILKGVVAKALSTSGFSGCPEVSCTSPQILSAFQTQYNAINFTGKGLEKETKRVNRILRSVKSGANMCDILAEVKREYKSTYITKSDYTDTLLEINRVAFTNKGACQFAVSSATGSILEVPVKDAAANQALERAEAAVTPVFSCGIQCRSTTALAALKQGVESKRSDITLSAVTASIALEDKCEYVVLDDDDTKFVVTLPFKREPITRDTPCVFTPLASQVQLYDEEEVQQVLDVKSGKYTAYLDNKPITPPILAEFSEDIPPEQVNADIDISVKLL